MSICHKYKRQIRVTPGEQKRGQDCP
ncbi:hypothetical protein EC80569_3582, partial [Escherichia coli 8.0569]